MQSRRDHELLKGVQMERSMRLSQRLDSRASLEKDYALTEVNYDQSVIPS